MKTKIFTFLLVAFGLMASTSAFAGGPDKPAPGQTSIYSVTAGTGFTISSYQWQILKDDKSTLAIEGTDYTTTGLGNANSTTIKWTASSAGKKYYIWVQGTDNKNCLTDPQTFEVNVSNTVVCIATATGKVGDVDAKEPTNVSGMCSLIQTSTSGATASGVDETDFYATITNGVASQEYTITYTVSSTKAGTNVVTKTTTLTTNSTGAGAVLIPVKATDYAQHFNMFGETSANTLTIAVTKAAYNGVEVTSNCSYTAIVNILPTISF
jgi:hypothetical protein